MFLPCLSCALLFAVGVFCETECPSVPAILGDRRENKNKLRLVQYNVEWLFVDYYASSDCPGNGCTWKNTSAIQTHLKQVEKVISELSPDIINFCEIEGCDEVNMLRESLNSTVYNSYLKKGTDTATGQNVGQLTKIDPLVSLYRTEERYAYPLPDSQCGYTGASGTTGVSKHYITEYNINGLDIAFIGAHLLAYPTDKTRCAEREAQAMVLQGVIANYVNKKYEIIFLGDLNDFDGEVLDQNNNKPTSLVLDILKGQDLYDLTNLAELVPQKERYTEWWDENTNCIADMQEFSMIDHVLVSYGLLEKIEKVSIYHGYEEKCGTFYPDHFPVVVDFLF
jgi:exonuclease III